MFSVVKTGKKTKKKSWKRMITKPTFVGPGFTRRPVKYEVCSYRVDATKTFTNPIYSASSGPWVCVTRRRTLRTPNSTSLFSCQSCMCLDELKGSKQPSLTVTQISKEEPATTHVHATRCPNKGNHYRSQRFRAWSRNRRRKSRMGTLRTVRLPESQLDKQQRKTNRIPIESQTTPKTTVA